MLKFQGQLIKRAKVREKIRGIIAEKLLENTRVKLLFAILPELCDTCRAILFPIGSHELQKSDREKQSLGPK